MLCFATSRASMIDNIWAFENGRCENTEKLLATFEPKSQSRDITHRERTSTEWFFDLTLNIRVIELQAAEAAAEAAFGAVSSSKNNFRLHGFPVKQKTPGSLANKRRKASLANIRCTASLANLMEEILDPWLAPSTQSNAQFDRESPSAIRENIFV